MSLRIGALTDIHWSLDPSRNDRWHNPFDFAGIERRVRFALQHFQTVDVDLVVLLGDFAHDGDVESLNAFFGLCRSTWRGPLAIVPGNHDLLEDPERVVTSIEGAPVSRMLGGFRVATVEIVSSGQGHYAAAAEQSEIAAGVPCLVLTHYPLFSQADLFESEDLRYAGDLLGSDELIRFLGNRTAPTIVLCGHLHARSTRVVRQILQLGLGSLIEPPHEFTTIDLELDGNGALLATRCATRTSTSSTDWPALSPSHEQWRFDDAEARWTLFRATDGGRRSAN